MERNPQPDFFPSEYRSTTADGHICLRQPCYYCMIRANKPIPAELLVGPPPRRVSTSTKEVDLSRLPAHSRPLVISLLRQLDGSKPQPADEERLTADLSRLAPRTCSSVLELLDQLADRRPEALRLIAASQPDPEFLATVVLSRKGVILECETDREHDLAKPVSKLLPVHVSDVLPRLDAYNLVLRIRALFEGGRERPPSRLVLTSQLGRPTCYERRYRRRRDRAILDIFRVPSVLDRVS